MAAVSCEKVHLVGSIGLDSVEEILRTAGMTLGRRLVRVPDGEVGPRRLWLSFQYPLLRSSPFLRPIPRSRARDIEVSKALSRRRREGRGNQLRRTRLCA